MKSKLKKRLRKKNHVGEFTELGVSIFVKIENIHNFSIKDDDRLSLDKTYDDIISIIDSDITMFTVGGGNDYLLCSLIDLATNNKITESNLEIIKNKIEQLDNVLDVWVFPIFDAWKFSDKDIKREELLTLEIKNKLGVINSKNN